MGTTAVHMDFPIAFAPTSGEAEEDFNWILTIDDTEQHRHCAREMYRRCKTHNFIDIWAYMWVNWYELRKWRI
ncbi:hypothetical protein K470DRAFT_135311 [Piedraia hortae CBS 480.64]|uniref:Uncharacterized protein n=1 Tax=Piedraia hortae CBS 480.64 TaxID=1314780 RepID=A0A6A7BUE3_9PEZI|nr:hypothetical protein K470DRAFT_135311 [Piedraia hortae CBS 480.64]